MAGTLIESLSGEFDPTEFHDSYREALEELIEAKVEGQEIVAPATTAPDTGAVVDLMAALRAIVEAAKSGRTVAKPTKQTESKRAAKAPAKKAPAKKPAAKKPAAAKKQARKSA